MSQNPTLNPTLPLTLLRLHIEAVWHVRLPLHLTDDVEIAQESVQPSWKLCVAELVDGRRVHIWRPDVAPLERDLLRLRADEALVFPPLNRSLPGVSREVAFSQIAQQRIQSEAARHSARLLTPADRSLLEVFRTTASPDDLEPQFRPLVGVVRSGQLLSLALSSRRTAEACELGIDTLPIARRQGWALAATVLWTEMIRQEGLVPLYSALAENTASLNLAHAAGYRPFARAATITE